MKYLIRFYRAIVPISFSIVVMHVMFHRIYDFFWYLSLFSHKTKWNVFRSSIAESIVFCLAKSWIGEGCMQNISLIVYFFDFLGNMPIYEPYLESPLLFYYFLIEPHIEIFHFFMNTNWLIWFDLICITFSVIWWRVWSKYFNINIGVCVCTLVMNDVCESKKSNALCNRKW